MVKTNDIVRDIFFTILLLIDGFLALFLLPQLFLFAGGGVEQEINLWKFTIYTSLGTFCILFIIVTKWARFFFKSIPSLSWINSIGHDPEDSLLSKIPLVRTITNNLVLLALFSLVILLPVSIGASLQKENTWYPDTILPKLEQQVTETAELGLSVYPASRAETLSLAVLISISIMGLGLLKMKGIIDVFIFNIIKLVFVPFLGAISWLLYHLARYGTSEKSLIAVFLFGLISSILIVLFNSIIPALIYHDVNNLVKKLFCFSSDTNGYCTSLFSSDKLLVVLGTVEVFLILIFLYLLIINYFKDEDKKDIEPNFTPSII